MVLTHEPPADLLTHLRNDPDTDLADTENVGSPSNRHLRLFVAAWVLPRLDGDQFDIRGALRLYDGSGNPGLLDSPGRLEVAGIYAEVLSLLEPT
jgi:hypothetical protein